MDSSREFMNKIQRLMNIQQSRQVQNDNNIQYKWIYKKQIAIKLISAKDEFLIFQALQEVKQEQKVAAMKHLVEWFENHPRVQVEKIPEMYLAFLHGFHTMNLINDAAVLRRSSLRTSFRRISNKIAPSPVLPVRSNSIIYHISK